MWPTDGRYIRQTNLRTGVGHWSWRWFRIWKFADEAELKKRKVKVIVQCVTCKEDTLTGFFASSDQSTKLTFRSEFEVYPHPNPDEEPEKRSLYHMVGPVGLYNVTCEQEEDNEDYIAQTEPHTRYFHYSSEPHRMGMSNILKRCTSEVSKISTCILHKL